MQIEEYQNQLKYANDEVNKGNIEIGEQIANNLISELTSRTPVENSMHSLHINAMLILANIAYKRNKYDEVLELTNASLEIAQKYGLTKDKAIAWNLIGNVYISLRLYDKALKFYELALSIHKELGDRSKEALVVGNLGIVYDAFGLYDKSLEYYNSAIQIHEELNEQNHLGRIYGNIGQTYINLGDYDKALEYFQQSISIHEELKNKIGIKHIMTCIGNLYYHIKSFDKALEYYLKVKEKVINIEDTYASINIDGNIGLVYAHLGQHEKALELMMETLDSFEKLGEKLGMGLFYGNIAGIYADKTYIGYDFKKAEEFLLKAISVLSEINRNAELGFYYKSISELYEQEKHNTEALLYFKKYIEVKDTLKVEEAKRQESIREQQKAIEIERVRASAEIHILNNILPQNITSRLIKGENPIADHFEGVSVLFMDIVDFTPLSASINAQQLVYLLNLIFTTADIVMREYGMEKIKTIGDSYMAVAGAPIEQSDHAERAAKSALRLLDVMNNFNLTFPKQNEENSWLYALPKIKVRIGLHCGPAAAGVVGESKFAYDLWGDSVNTASRMESHGETGKIHISEDFKNALGNNYTFRERGEIDVKGKGKMKTYFLEKK